ncbi:hypothetical protein AURDEDRAFT_160629, partial [Auricularia subglabra TFB-10046 SS5]
MGPAKEDLTARLPPETLYSIIDCVPADERNPCAHVSRRWRSIAFDNYSSCWFRPRCQRLIQLHEIEGPASIAVGLAQLKCRAEHPSTVSVHIFFGRTSRSDADAALLAIPLVLHRVEHLSLCFNFGHPDPTQYFDALAHPAPHLHTVDLAVGNSPNPVCLRGDLFARDCPTLARLNLSNIDLPSEPLPQLCRLSSIRLDEAMQPFGMVQNPPPKPFPEDVFVHSPNLEE